MSVSRSDVLRPQFDLAWALFGHHLQRLEPGDFLWESGLPPGVGRAHGGTRGAAYGAGHDRPAVVY